jgi:hypothetical protein
MSKFFIFDKQTRISFSGKETGAIKYALSAFLNDLEKVLGYRFEVTYSDYANSNCLHIVHQEGKIEDESFSINLSKNCSALKITGKGELAVIFAIYHLSEHILGIDPFWFWTDFEPAPKEFIKLESYSYESPSPAMRFRGWFINGEDCLLDWKAEDMVTEDVWKVIFETMLRAKCNMVIPGTNVPFNSPQVKLAGKMGLWITQHHAEPLGARLFGLAFPGEPAHFHKQKDKFGNLYREAIEGYVKNKNKVIYVLGFRGQGDHPFWYDDPEFDTSKKRGALISEVIRFQKRLVEEIAGNTGPLHFAAYIYGEQAELYQQGFLDIDDDITLIWAWGYADEKDGV